MQTMAMPELRWTLLVLGVLFLGGMAWWESRRNRRTRQADLERLAGDGEPRERDADADGEVPLPSFSARDPERLPAHRPLPVYELPAGQEDAAPARRVDPVLDFQDEAPAGAAHEPVISDLPLEAAQDFEPGFDELGVGQVRVIEPAASAAPVAAGPGAGVTAVAVAEVEPAAAWLETAAQQPAAVAGDSRDAGVQAAAAPARAAEPVVDWPEHSRIVAVRVMAPREKFLGRAVRLALTSQGFVPGKFSIYHKPAPDGRALLSVASLTKPGTFDAARLDLQRFSGLNLFTVLPGPLPDAVAVEELLHSAEVLATRLQGELRDDRGEALSADRVAQLRAAAAATAA